MATNTISIPHPNLLSPSTWGSREAVKGQVEKIMKNYGSYIKTASENSRIPAQVIASFIAVESGGNPTAGGSGSYTQGLMQWNRKYAQNFLEAERDKGRLTPEEKSVLMKYGVMDSKGNIRTITQADLVKPELNIMVGSILLGQYTDSMHDGGKSTIINGTRRYWAKDDRTNELRLDRIIAVYNGGAYSDMGVKARTGTHADAKALADNVHTTTSSYIRKMLGKNGAMDVATNELKGYF